MRKLLTILLFLTSLHLSAQMKSDNLTITPIQISDIKWVYIRFNSAVTYADMGTRDIILQKTSLPNVIRIKSDVPAFDETSVTVIIQSGEVYTFLLTYADNPNITAINLNTSPSNTILENQVVKPLSAEISNIKTTHLIFPEKIVDVSVGNSNLIAAERIEDFDNIIRCKSLNSSFDIYNELNIIALGESGTIYPFNVTFSENPKQVSLAVGGNGNKTQKAKFTETSVNATSVPTIANAIFKKGQKLNIGTIGQKIYFILNSIFVINDVIMFNLSILNKSNVDYEIDFIRCYIVNNRTAKKQAFQMDIKEPLYSFSNDSIIIRPNTNYQTVQFHKRFTIPNKHSLYFEIFEKNGGRHLKFTVPNDELLKANTVKLD